jgi:dTDP-4-dehydrorhamnose reductase
VQILIIGVDGAIGGALAAALRARGHHVVGTTRKRANVCLPDTMFVDLASDDLAPLPAADATVICAAMARFEECRNQPKLAHRVNVERPVAIADQQLPRGGHVLLLSTSAVFDCLEPLRKADDVRSPRSAYGRLKAEAELRLLDSHKDAAVLRLTKVMRAEAGLLAEWIAALAAGRTVTAFDDHRFCPLPLASVIEAITVIMTSGENGLFQVSGVRDISYVEAALHLASRLGRPANQVTAVSAASAGIPTDEITPYTSLDTSRLSAMMGFVPPRPFDVLDSIYGPALARASTIAAAR